MPKHAVYLWTLPMFHCNGWCFPWTVAARAGVNVCLRRVEAQAIFDAIREHGVTHYCGAPIVHGLLVNAPAAMKAGIPAGVKAMVAGAAPPASMIEGMEAMGFDLTHVYGLTEVYGPATVCAKHEAWDRARHRRARAPERPPGRALPPAARRARAEPRDDAAGAAGRRDHGRDHVQGQHHHEGLPEESRGDARGLRRWLVPQRRPGGAIPRRLFQDQGPQQGHHHLGRREHFLHRGGRRAVPPPRRAGRRGGGAAGTRSGARRLAPSWSSSSAHRPRPRRSWCIARSTWRASRCRVSWCSGNCQKPAPARSRNSSCASALAPPRRSMSEARNGPGSLLTP
jgi:hypothetical protein